MLLAILVPSGVNTHTPMHVTWCGPHPLATPLLRVYTLHSCHFPATSAQKGSTDTAKTCKASLTRMQQCHEEKQRIEIPSALHDDAVVYIRPEGPLTKWPPPRLATAQTSHSLQLPNSGHWLSPLILLQHSSRQKMLSQRTVLNSPRKPDRDKHSSLKWQYLPISNKM